MKTLHAVSPKIGQNSLSNIWLPGYKSPAFVLPNSSLKLGYIDLHSKSLRRMRDEEHL